VHLSYGPLIQKLLPRFNAACHEPGAANGRGKPDDSSAIKGLAHITGGGFVDNIPRILPRHCEVIIRKGSWEVLPIFQILQAQGSVTDAELYQVFNMGIGMAIIVADAQADAILRFIRAQGQRAWLIGEVVKGQRKARVV
jgi:phosphoribosylformylglycinamidine cyclo-ligase